MRIILSFILTLILVSSCNLRIEKRRYMKGYHVEFSGRNTGQNKQRSENKKDKINPIAKLNSFSKDSLHTTNVQNKSVIPSSIVASRNFQHQKVNPKTKTIPQGVTLQNKNADHEFNFTATTAIKSTINSDQKKEKSDGMFLALCGGFAAAVSLLFKPLIPKTRKLGYWALNHRKATRVLHFGMHSLLAASGFFLGGTLFDLGLISTSSATAALTGVGSLLLLIYPHRKMKTGLFKNTYALQKWFALAVTLTGLLFFVNLGNRYASEKYLDKTYSSISVLEGKYIHQSIEKLASPEKGKGLSDSDRKALAVLVIFSCVVLCIAITGAACALACSGQGLLAIMVLVAGLPVVIIGAVKLVERIMAPVKAKKKIPEPK